MTGILKRFFDALESGLASLSRKASDYPFISGVLSVPVIILLLWLLPKWQSNYNIVSPAQRTIRWNKFFTRSFTAFRMTKGAAQGNMGRDFKDDMKIQSMIYHDNYSATSDLSTGTASAVKYMIGA